MKILILVFILVAFGAHRSNAEESNFRVLITPVEQTIVVESMPVFVIEITNITDRPIRDLIRIDRRSDWATASLKLHISKDGEPVKVGVMICDPDFLGKDDYFDMPSGATIRVRMDWYPNLYDELPPGEYDAYFMFHAYAKVEKKHYRSNQVKVRIIPKQEPNQAQVPTPTSVTDRANARSAPAAGAAQL